MAVSEDYALHAACGGDDGLQMPLVVGPGSTTVPSIM